MQVLFMHMTIYGIRFDGYFVSENDSLESTVNGRLCFLPMVVAAQRCNRDGYFFDSVTI